MKITAREVASMRKLRDVDGLDGAETAAIVGCHLNTVYEYAPGRPGTIPNELVREAFLRSGLSAGEVAIKIGWMQRGKGDGARLKRALGVLRCRDENGSTYVNRRINVETATLIAEAIGVDLWEIGA